MNVQLANTSRQTNTTTAQDTFTYVGYAVTIYTPLILRTVTIYPTAEPAILLCACTQVYCLAQYQNDETFLYHMAENFGGEFILADWQI